MIIFLKAQKKKKKALKCGASPANTFLIYIFIYYNVKMKQYYKKVYTNEIRKLKHCTHNMSIRFHIKLEPFIF